MFRKYYLAYGSNLNLDEMQFRCPSATPIGTTILYNHHLVFKGSAEGYSYLTIEKSEGSYVPLGIFSISIFDEKKLDIYEGYQELYHKNYITININGRKIDALIYIMNKEFTYHLPSKRYIETCLEGYRNFGFNPNLIKEALINTKINNKGKTK